MISTTADEILERTSEKAKKDERVGADIVRDLQSAKSDTEVESKKSKKSKPMKEQEEVETSRAAAMKNLNKYYFGFVAFKPQDVHSPPDIIANRDLYKQHVQKIAQEMRIGMESYPAKPGLVCAFEVSLTCFCYCYCGLGDRGGEKAMARERFLRQLWCKHNLVTFNIKCP